MATSMVLSSSTALVLALNLLFFSLVTSTHCNCNTPPHKHKPIHKPPPHHPTPTPKPPTTPTPTPKPPTTPTPTPPVTPTPKPPTTPTPTPPVTPTPKPPTTPTPTPPVTPTPKPPTTPTPTPPTTPAPVPTPTQESCPRDALKLGVCANVLGGLLTPVIGTPPKEPCCTLLNGLTDLEAAVCLCTAIKANILGINLNVAVDLSLLLNYCGKETPTGFQCS